jgi:filamentous hemagglutinin
LPPKSTTFDHFKGATGEAISNKTLNTLSVSYIKNPESIYGKVAGYVDKAVNYAPRRSSDLDPKDIVSKTVHLAIPEYTNPTQWRHLLRAIIYGKDNDVSVVITRFRR